MKPVNFFPRFNNLSEKSISVDYHLHSTWTDGSNTVSEIIESARINGVSSIAITDHIRKESTYFDDYKKHICALDNKTGINVYVGFEAKISDFSGNIDVKDCVVKNADVAIASVHRYPLGQKLYKASEFKKEIAQEIELELTLAALEKGGFNVLGHTGGMSSTNFGEFPIKFYEEIIKKCARSEIAFDLSGRYHLKSFDVIYPLLVKYNPFVSIGSDSHSIRPLGDWNKYLKDHLL